jgi:hypothetical protein
MSGGMNTLFANDPMAFMEAFAVAPPDAVGTYIGVTTQNMATTASPADYAFSKIEPTKRIAYLNFVKGAKRASANVTFMPLAEQVATFTASFGQISKRHVPAYFLPWSAQGAIIRLTIPRLANIAPGDADSSIFFTATITGCSIFIKGTPDHPTIYHAGGQTGQNDPTQAAQFWENLMTLHSHRPGGIVGRVDKRQYISEPGVAGGTSTQEASIYEAFLQNQNRTDLQVDFVRPWGCVMGLRDAAGNWKFYLQENATIFFAKFEKVKGAMVRGTVRSMARPMAIREIYPAQSGRVQLMPPMPRKI